MERLAYVTPLQQVGTCLSIMLLAYVCTFNSQGSEASTTAPQPFVFAAAQCCMQAIAVMRAG